jgi:hypothetical protein
VLEAFQDLLMSSSRWLSVVAVSLPCCARAITSARPDPQSAAGSAVVVDVINDGDLKATVHWRGLRLERSMSVSLR